MTQLCCANITRLLKDPASLHGLILTRDQYQGWMISKLKSHRWMLLHLPKQNIGSVSMMPRTDLHDPWPCMFILTCSWQPSAHLTTTQQILQIQRTENLGLWWWVYMCAMRLVNAMFSWEGMNQMTTCSSRDNRRAKANLSHEEPSPSKCQAVHWYWLLEGMNRIGLRAF